MEFLIYKKKMEELEIKGGGLMIGIQDVLIAASSISANTSLITNNTKHFQKIEGLKLE